MTRTVSARLSPLAAEEVTGSTVPSTLPPRRTIAVSNENRVRVLGS